MTQSQTQIQKTVADVQKQEIEAKLRYQRALYRGHDTDDPDLKQYFQSLINDYERTHDVPGKKKEDPRQMVLFPADFVGHGLA